LRLVIDIQDDAVTKWGSIYIHNPQYDASKVAIFLPGFESKTEVGQAVKVHVLPSPQAADNKPVAKPEGQQQGSEEEKKMPEQLSVATPAEDDAKEPKDAKPPEEPDKKGKE